MIIRDLASTDRAQWAPLWAGYLAFYEATLDPAVTETTWARLLDPAEPMFALAAQGDDGALLGIVHCVLHRGTWAIENFCYLEDLFVAPEARGQGVGRALIEAVYTRADALGCSRVYWLTHETNATARQLYDRIAEHRGFIQYRRP
jgi:GNAT superfamily N-acetyltransferase